MKWIVTVFALVVTVATSFSQVKDDISVVQYSAEFVKSKEISLNDFSQYNTQTLYLTKHPKIFKAVITGTVSIAGLKIFK